MELLVTIIFSAAITISALLSHPNWVLALARVNPLATAVAIAIGAGLIAFNNAARNLAIGALFASIGTFIAFQLLMKGQNGPIKAHSDAPGKDISRPH